MTRTLNYLHRRARDLLSRIRPNVPPVFWEATDLYAKALTLGRPWIADGRLWAGDGVMLVSAWLSDLRLSDRELALYSAEGRSVPDLANVVRGYWYHPTPVRLPDAERMVVCEECGGSRYSQYDTDYPCYNCEGSGLELNYAKRKVGDSDTYLISYRIAILREHGVDRVLIPMREEWPVRFDKGVMTGYLMPCKGPYPHEIEAKKNARRAD